MLQKQPTSTITPSLKLVMALEIFNTLKNATTQNMAEPAPKTPSPKTKIFSWLRPAYTEASSCSPQTATVLKIQMNAPVNGSPKKFARLSGVNFILELDGSKKDTIKSGDVIAMAGVTPKKAGEPTTAKKIDIVAPKDLMAFLKYVEPDFMTHGTVDANSGTLIFGQILSINKADNIIIIKDKNNKSVLVHLTENEDHPNLKERNFLIALPSKLNADGTYTINPKDTFKLKAPYAGRVLIGLQRADQKIGSADAPYAQTEQEDHQTEKPSKQAGFITQAMQNASSSFALE